MATKTTNYNLTKPSGNDDADISVINANMDIIDTKMKEIEDAGGGSGCASSAIDVSYDNSTSQMSATNVQGAIDEVFQSVSDGKVLIAGAITDKGVITSATDTFQTMASNIGKISGGSGETDKVCENAQISDTSQYLTAQTDRDYTNYTYLMFKLTVNDVDYMDAKKVSDITSGTDFKINSHKGYGTMSIQLTSSTVKSTHYTGDYFNVYLTIYGIK